MQVSTTRPPEVSVLLSTRRPFSPSRWRLRAVLAVVLVALVAPVGAAAATAADRHGPDTRLGTTGARFWQWGLTQPAATNPLFDTTGEFCDAGQHGRTWFLAGYTGGPITRTCTVRPGTTLVFPVVNAFYGATPGDPPEQSTVAYVRSQVAGLRAAAHDLRVTVDGTVLDPSRIRYEDSVVFSVTLPDGNVFGAPAETVVAPTVDAGYYVTLRPLRPGTHTVRIEGAVDSTAPLGSFAVDVTYVLTVPRGHGH